MLLIPNNTHSYQVEEIGHKSTSPPYHSKLLYDKIQSFVKEGIDEPIMGCLYSTGALIYTSFHFQAQEIKKNIFKP